jgi:hypothetical protein
MIDSLVDLADTLVMCGGLAVIVWLGLRKRNLAWPPAATIGMLVWLIVFGCAIYLAIR